MSPRRRVALSFVLSSVMVALPSGCVEPASDYGPVEAYVTVEDEVDFEYLWDATLRVLRRANLTPDRQDSRDGIIITKPITSQQWFELWRHDAMGPYQWAEASMHTVQRLAKIKIDRLDEPGRYRVGVQVDVFRYSAPERQVTTPSGALLIYSEKLPTEQGERIHPHLAVHWVRLGRDVRMEGVLLRRILMHYPGAHELAQDEPEPLEWEGPTDEDLAASGLEPDATEAPGAEGGPTDPDPDPVEPTGPEPPKIDPAKAKALWRGSARPEPVGPPTPR